MRAMRQFGYADWRNQRVIIFGYGKVGRGVAYACAREGARVTVVDRPSIPVDKAHVDRLVDCQDVGAVRQAVAESRHLVTATGIRGAMRRYGLDAEILKKMVIAAIGIEDEWLEALDPSLLLNHGEAVNFSLDEPTRLRYIDPTMALMNESAVDLLTGRVAKPGISSPDPLSEQRCLTPVVNAGLITEEISLFEVLR